MLYIICWPSSVRELIYAYTIHSTKMWIQFLSKRWRVILIGCYTILKTSHAKINKNIKNKSIRRQIPLLHSRIPNLYPFIKSPEVVLNSEKMKSNKNLIIIFYLIMAVLRISNSHEHFILLLFVCPHWLCPTIIANWILSSHHSPLLT